MTASRADLLIWLNELLQINYTKIEQCGTGGAYCQILDSIYGKIFLKIASPFSFHDRPSLHIHVVFSFVLGDLPMNRVKMTAKHEYEYLANYKVMQTVFKNKKIDKVCVRLSFLYFGYH